MTAITSPIEGFNGTTVVGTTTLTFKDGVADAKDVPEGVLGYLRTQGYTVDGETVDLPKEPEPIDSRDVVEEQFGEKARDAAVDPHADDFLAPVNAGKADPHGPKVVAPQLHAAKEQPVRPGKVSDDASEQDKAESEHAADLFTEEPKKPAAKRAPAKKAATKSAE